MRFYLQIRTSRYDGKVIQQFWFNGEREKLNNMRAPVCVFSSGWLFMKEKINNEDDIDKNRSKTVQK